MAVGLLVLARRKSDKTHLAEGRADDFTAVLVKLNLVDYT